VTQLVDQPLPGMPEPEALAVHPVADLFPMLASDELAELAADIEQRGQLQPIVLDIQGRVLDGRNRLAACRLVGVAPTFTTYEGDDPDGFALAVNIARRHLSKGQQAMIAARWRLVSKQSQRATAEATGLNAGRIGQAAIILDHAPDLADSVVSGAMSLDIAYETARKNKQGRDNRETQMAELRADAPDLADLVIEERMTLADAVAAAKERKRVEADRRRRLSAGFGADLVRLMSVLDPDPVEFLSRTWEPEANPHRDLPGARELFTVKGLRQLAVHLDVLADHLDETGGDLL
jgi:ParB-like chromosome segregation protein Spo0J